MATSPIVARWELSRRLATLRKDQGLDVKTITEHLGFTRNYWSAVENDRTVLTTEKLDLFFDLVEIEEEEQAELLQLRDHARERGWWDDHPEIDEAGKRLFGLEAGATEIRIYEPHLVPGLLQIEEYSRAVIGADPRISPARVEDFVSVRQRRRRVFSDAGGPSLTALLGEAVLLHEVAGESVQKAQLRHLKSVASDTHGAVELRVLPFKAAPAAIISSSTLVLLQFANSRHLPAIAWQEAIRTLDPVEEGSEEFRSLELAWKEGLSRSLSREDSLKRLDEVLGG